MERVLATSSGRYKFLKLVQYTARVVLLLATHKHLRLSRNTHDKLVTLARQCSLQRRILQLGNLYGPLKALTLAALGGRRGKVVSGRDLVVAVSGLVEDASEDIATLSQLGWLPARCTHAAVYADRAWLVSLLLEMHEVMRQKRALWARQRVARMLDQRPKQDTLQRRTHDEAEAWWLDLAGVRIACDLGQAWCDVFEVQLVSDAAITGCAFTSAVIGMYTFTAKS